MSSTKPHCLVCQRDSEFIPLLRLEYKDTVKWVCPQHLPILIHRPTQLADEFPEAEQWGSAEHEH